MKMDGTDKVVVWFFAFIFGGPMLIGVVAVIAEAVTRNCS